MIAFVLSRGEYLYFEAIQNNDDPDILCKVVL